ncbi:cadherin-related family member 5 [Thunnus albacares]|uniref:cadherin-related family member 5 n=1 Tax=Thunnus albacares TaxID=8236 RepID=UPI001CF71719|nr:cadherin-related family member 5 [Thunnus albacares]XP_044198544.1 cadherin-related family member 5 [Thunnus albacares]
MLRSCRLLLWQVALRLSYHVVTASLCLGGSDIFASIRENSPTGQFIANLSVSGDPRASAIRLCLTGENSDWFFLEGRTIRLNSSSSRVLDREVHGSVLIAELTCYEDDVIQSQYRILVEILNENDNKPNFLEETIQPFTINELTAVNSVVFTVKAVDADGDMITYIIDQSLPDASFFRIDLPNSGNVVLDKPLDYETRTHLQLLIWAEEANSVEKFNTTATLMVNIEDGDDQYPHFLPCTPVSPGVPVCTNPTYTANITETHQEVVLQFSPGPIRAEDGDRGLDSPLIYTILSGGDQGRFVIDDQTGEIRLTRAVDDRQQTPNFRLSIMASQLDDPLKYSVASVLVRVLSENAFPPFFNRTIYKGFIIQSSSPASIVSTYGNQVLLVQVSDWDFSDGLNPNIRYSLHPPSVSDGRYHITQGGVLIARTDRLHAFDRHILEVVARDEESGEEVSTSVDIEVLQRGQPVPRGAFTEEQLFRDVDSRLAGGIAAMIVLLFLSALLFLLLRIIRRRRQREPDEQGTVTLGKPPSVVSSGRPVFSMDEMSYNSRAFSHEYESSRSGSFHGRQGIYTRKQSLRPPPSSSSSSTIILDPGSTCRSRSDLFPVSEIPELQPAVKGDRPTVKEETHRLSVVKEEPGRRQSLQGQTEGVSTGVQSDDIRAVKSETLHSDDVKTNQTEEMSQESENPYRTMVSVICLSADESSSEDGQ